MIYLTVGDPYSGVISSQVADVCLYLQQTFQVRMRLIAFISIRDFFAQRRKFRTAFPGAWVLPMVPQLRNWRMNRALLWLAVLFSGERKVISRGILATNLALRLRKSGWVKSVCFDARGAYAAEWEEYDVVADKQLIREVAALEQQAVQDSDMRLAVSQKLIDLWKREYQYSDGHHVIIPCTINTFFDRNIPSLESIKEKRQKYGFQEKDIIAVYAGSSAGWQSLQLLDKFFTHVLAGNPDVKILLLANWNLEDLHSWRSYPTRIQSNWVKHQEVFDVLSMCDYGVLIREDSVTNEVAAPTKFAEYLAAGLPVLITDNIGDYPDFVRRFEAGYISEAERLDAELVSISYNEKLRINRLARTYFTKHSFREAYSRILT